MDEEYNLIHDDEDSEPKVGRRHLGSVEGVRRVEDALCRIGAVEKRLRWGFRVQLPLFLGLFLLNVILFAAINATHSRHYALTPAKVSGDEEGVSAYESSIRPMDLYYPPSITWSYQKKKDRFGSITDSYSDAFLVKGYDLRARAKIFDHGYDIWTTIDFLSSDELKVKVLPEVKYVLKDTAGNHRDIVRYKISSFKKGHRSLATMNSTVKLGSNFEIWSPYSSIYNKHKEDSQLLMDVYVEPPRIRDQFYSEDGLLTWKVDHYKTKLLSELNEEVEFQPSPYFYTHPRGYRVRAHVQLAGFNVSIAFLSGPYDQGLSLDFAHRTTVTIFNIKNPAKHLVKSVERNLRTNSTYSIFMDHYATVLDPEHGFLAKDTLYYQVQIEKL